MADRKRKGDLAEMAIAADLIRLGHRVAIPVGEDCDFDLVLIRDEGRVLERVQVKHTVSDGNVIEVRCYSQSLTNGRVRTTKRYTCRTIDWLAVYDATTRRCFYVPASELGAGRRVLTLRYASPFVGWRRNMRRVEDYAVPGPA